MAGNGTTAKLAAAALSIAISWASYLLMHDQRGHAINYGELAKKISEKLDLVYFLGGVTSDDGEPGATNAADLWTWRGSAHVIKGRPSHMYFVWKTCVLLFSFVDVGVILRAFGLPMVVAVSAAAAFGVLTLGVMQEKARRSHGKAEKIFSRAQRPHDRVVTDAGMVDWRALNRANWDDRVPVHLEGYDLAAFRARTATPRPFELAEVGDVNGKRLVHLQCHIGLDTLSWQRNGARAWGLDFSAPAVDAARSLAASLQIDASFVVSDVYDAAAAFGGQRFDIVYTGIGALVWLPDLQRWAEVVSSLLSPGGFLYLVGHPFAQILNDSSGGTVVRDYDGSPRVVDYPGTDTGGPALDHRSVQFQHSMDSVQTALLNAELQIDFAYKREPDAPETSTPLPRRNNGTYLFPQGQAQDPMIFSLRASRPARWTSIRQRIGPEGHDRKPS